MAKHACGNSFRTAEDYRDHLPCRSCQNLPEEQVIGFAILSSDGEKVRTGQYPHLSSKLYKTKGSAKTAAKNTGLVDFEVITCFAHYGDDGKLV